MENDIPPPDPLEWLKRMMAPGIGPAAVHVPLFDVADIERRIAELRAVEGWMNAQLKLLQLSVEALEVQKRTLQAMGAPGGTAQSAADASHASMEAWTQMLQQFQAAIDAAKPK